MKQKSVSFHGPSFSSGALIGAAIVLTAAYAPEFLRSTELNSGAEASSEQQPAVQFELVFEGCGDPVPPTRGERGLTSLKTSVWNHIGLNNIAVDH